MFFSLFPAITTHVVLLSLNVFSYWVCEVCLVLMFNTSVCIQEINVACCVSMVELATKITVPVGMDSLESFANHVSYY